MVSDISQYLHIYLVRFEAPDTLSTL